MRKLFLLVTMFLACAPLMAQQFPVQVTPQLLPPYSMQVSEYFSPSSANTKLSLLLLNRDFAKPTLNVRLRMSIESQTIRLKTREDVMFTPVTIYAGQPYYVQPSELTQYFNVNNLEISGMNPTEYTAVGKLPEGFYTFCFEVVEITTGQTVSNKGCSFAWMNLNDPPMLNLPRKDDKLAPLMPQNIIFNWTPRQTASPGAAYTTIYILTLVELNPASTNPEADFITSPVLFTDSLTGTTLVYDAGKPQLQPNHKYAWRVQAKTKDGITEVANFKNNGYSEIFWFTYKNSCPLVLGVDTSDVHGYNATINWLDDPQQIGYKIIYREKSNPKAEWFSVFSNGTQAMLGDLKPNTEYEYRVGGACEEGNYNFVATRSFTTKDSSITAVANCGDSSNLSVPANTNPLATMTVPDTIHAGDFNVIVTEVSGSAGTFSGKGYVPVSYLANMKLAVVFNGIGVNAEKKLVSGKIETTYDPSEGGITDIDEIIDYYTAGYGVGSVVTGDVKVDTTFGFTIGSTNNIVPTLPPGYDNTTGMGPVHIIVTPSGGGTPVGYDAPKLPTTLMDAAGNIYQVNKDGTVSSLGRLGGSQWLKTTNKTLIDDNKARVDFVDYDDPKVKFAFDAWKPVYKNSNSFNKEYERIRTANNDDYYVSAKAIAPAITDYLLAKVKITDNNIKADSIQFVNGKGTIYTSTKLTDSTYEIAVVGGPEKDAQEIYALYPKADGKTLNLGKVLVASYPRREYKVKLVPVKDASVIQASEIEQGLNNIYNKINIWFTVSKEDVMTGSSWDQNNDGLNVKGSSFLSAFTPEMEAVRDLHRQSNISDGNTVVIFLLGSAADSTTEGDMPRSQQYGFVFYNGNNHVPNTIAHEIGHGMFNLLHSFSDKYGFSTSDLPDNLMNYNEQFSLSKYQWDLCNDPALVYGIFDNDGVSKSLQYPNLKCINDANEISRLGKIFLNVNGESIKLKNDEVPYAFFAEKEGSPFKGRLAGFLKNGVLYGYLRQGTGSSEIASHYYSRYNQTNSDEYYPDSYIDISQAAKVIISSNNLYQGQQVTVCKCEGYPTVAGKEVYKDVYFGKPKASATNAYSIKVCEDDLFDSKPLLDNSSLGEYLVSSLEYRKKANQQIPSNDPSKLASYDPGDADYIAYNYASSQFVKKIYYDELNRKLGYLKMSSGYEIYIDFITSSCAVSESLLTKLAEDVFKKGQLQQKAIYVVYSLYENDNSFQFSAGKAYGLDVPSNIKNIIASEISNLDTETGVQFSIVNTYRRIPKTRLLYTEKIFDAPVGSLFGVAKEAKQIVYQSEGNAIDIAFYLCHVGDEDNSYTHIFQNPIATLKEDALKSIITRTIYTTIIANKYSNWHNNPMTYKNTEEGDVTVELGLPQCDFSFHKSCNDELIDGVILIASLIPIPGLQPIILAGATFYYLYNGEPDMALGYAIGLGFEGAIASGLFKAAFVGAKQLGTEIVLFTGRSVGGQLRNKIFSIYFSSVVKQSIKGIAKDLVVKEASTSASSLFVREVGHEASSARDYKNLFTKYISESETGKKYLVKYSINSSGDRVIIQYIDEVKYTVDEINAITDERFARLGDDIVTDATNSARLTLQQIDDWVKFATKQNDKSKVMFGMWDGGGVNSYTSKAGTEYTYFDFGDKWDELYNLVNKSDDEIWKINKEFIDRQRSANKEFWFSHDPFSAKNEQFFAREVNYFIDLKVKNFQKIGDLWKAVW